MSFSKDFGLGFSTYGKAFGILFRTNLWWTILIPFVFNLILIITGFEIKEYVVDFLQKQIIEITNLNNADFFMSDVLRGSLSWIVGISFTIIFFFFFAYFGGYIVLILMSPVFAYVSEQTEKHLTGKDYPFDIMQFTRDIWRGVLIASRNMLYQTMFFLAFLIIGAIPVLGWVVSVFSSVVLFFISSYFYGFSFMDYSNERKKLNISKSVKIIRKHKTLAIVNGGIFTITLLIPFCGVTLAGFFAIISAIAASTAMIEVYKEDVSSKTIQL